MREIEELVALGHSHGALAIHPYFGRMDPALAAILVTEFSQAGDWVLDPFCGSGTVLHEAVLLGRNVTGWDSSPLASMIAASKLVGLSPRTEGELAEFAGFIRTFTGPGADSPPLPASPVPEMPRVVSVAKWFGPNALRELAFLSDSLRHRESSEPAMLLLRVAFSRCITKASRQKGESTYSAVEKPDEPGRVFRLFLKALAAVSEAAAALTRMQDGNLARLEKSEGENYALTWEATSATVENRDSRSADGRSTAARSHDLIVTSPPYLMSWDYGLYHKFRFYWLGFDLDGYEESEVGRHLRRRNDDVDRYRADMLGVFGELSDWTHSGSRVAMVNAPSAVRGLSVDTNEILTQVASDNGFSLEWQGVSLSIPGPHHGMYASLSARNASTAGESGKREHVLLFARD